MFSPSAAAAVRRRAPHVAGIAAARIGQGSYFSVRGKVLITNNSLLPLPELDLDNIGERFKGVSFHNPFVGDLGKTKQAAPKATAPPVEKDQPLPKFRGEFPLPVDQEYSQRRKQFYEEHDGITQTITRKYRDRLSVAEIKNSEIAEVERAMIFSPRRANSWVKPGEKKYQDEFKFDKPNNATAATYFGHLVLYVQALRMMPASERPEYLDDFYYIIKAIRQRYEFHKAMVEIDLYRSTVAAYFSLANQDSLALYFASELTPLSLQVGIPRWFALCLLKSSSIPYSSPIKHDVEDADQADRADTYSKAAMRSEYRYNLVMRALLSHYRDSTDVCPTDTELLYLIIGCDGRRRKVDLREMMPILVQRLFKGPLKFKEADRLGLAHNQDVQDRTLDNMQLAMRYALALLRADSADACVRWLHTVVDMPPRTCSWISGTTSDVAQAMLGVVESSGRNVAFLVEILECLGASPLEHTEQDWRPEQSYLQLKQSLLANIETRMGDPSTGGLVRALTQLLKVCESELSETTVSQIIVRLMKRHPHVALHWVADNLFAFNKRAQEESVEWFVGEASKNRLAAKRIIEQYATAAPVEAARFLQAINGQLYKRESCRRYLLPSAFGVLARSGNPRAIGVALSCAAQQPEDTKASPLGPYSPMERMKATASLIRVAEDNFGGDPLPLLPHLFTVVGHLGGQETERALWREMLRCGVEPEWQTMQKALSLRTFKKYDVEGATELVRQLLAAVPVVRSEHGAMGHPALGDGEISALYIAILVWLREWRASDAFEILANRLLKSSDTPDLVFNTLVSVWLDIATRWPVASVLHVQRVWALLKRHANTPGRALNRSHYHALIAAYVRLGNIPAAWEVIQMDMSKAGLSPDPTTLLTLVSQLVSQVTLWPVGKSAVSKFYALYPDIVKDTVNSKNTPSLVKALLHQSLASEETTKTPTGA
ncbi:hypothetical protein GGF46_000301 [Coemansia sp. RSA 552]|nr:hypothetical protein GGF46_000301 [Coemansia sp. RSA 552]